MSSLYNKATVDLLQQISRDYKGDLYKSIERERDLERENRELKISLDECQRNINRLTIEVESLRGRVKNVKEILETALKI